MFVYLSYHFYNVHCFDHRGNVVVRASASENGVTLSVKLEFIKRAVVFVVRIGIERIGETKRLVFNEAF